MRHTGAAASWNDQAALVERVGGPPETADAPRVARTRRRCRGPRRSAGRWSHRRGGQGLAMSPPRSLAQWSDAVVEAFAAGHRFKDRDLKRAEALMRSLFDHLECCGITDLSEVTAELTLGWVWAEVQRRDGSVGRPARNTARYRQWLANYAFAAAGRLGAAVDPRAATGETIKRGALEVPPRPVTERELQQICDATHSRRRTSKKAVLVALSRASGSAAELPNVRARDVDLDAGTVKFAGSHERICALDPWSAQALADYLDANPVAPDEPLCVKADTAPDRAEDSVTTRLWQILAAAGLGEHHDVTARSIRLTEAQRVLRNEGIAAAAKFLGSSLDATAEALDYQWRSHSGAAAPDEAEDFGDG